MPEVSGTIESPFRHGELALGARLRLGGSLRGRYERAYVLPNSAKSALVPFFARIPQRTGFVGELRYGLINDARRLDEQALPQMFERFAALALGPGALLPDPLPRPRLQVAPQERAALLSRLSLSPEGRVACLCAGAEYGPAKRWPPQYFAEVAAQLAVEGFQVWIIGSAKEHGIGEAIRAAGASTAVNLCGLTSLDEAAVLLSRADVVLSNDSGLMHVAAALERPMVALYGSSSPAFTPPLSGAAHVMWLHLPCSPCFQRNCPLVHFNCMMQLDPARVLAEIHRIAEK